MATNQYGEIRGYALWVGLLCGTLLAGSASAVDGLSIHTYTPAGTARVNRYETTLAFYADITSTGPAYVNALASLTSKSPHIKVIKGSLAFGNIDAGATRRSTDTFIVRHDRRFPFDELSLTWNITADTAKTLAANFRAIPASGNAPLAVTFIPEPVTDNAIELYEWDRDGNGTFEVSDTVGRNQTFTYAKPGAYQPQLRIRDTKGAQDTKSVTVKAANQPPVITAQVSPASGEAPLTANFTGTASDNEGIATYEWDFEGNGTYDFNSATTASTSYIYVAVGTYNPIFRVTDKLGASTTYAVPSTVVRAAPPGALIINPSATPTSGSAPRAVSFSASATNANGRKLTWEWDFNGDGVYDYSGATAATSFTYTAGGTYFPRVRATAADGEKAEGALRISISSTVALSRTMDTIDALQGETTSIKTTLGGDTQVSVVVESAAGQVIRTVVPWTQRAAGAYTDTWNGRGDDGNPVAEGPYYAVLLYKQDGAEKRLDLRLTTGGSQYNPPRSGIPSNFAPLAGKPLTIDFTLNEASEVTAFIGRFNVNARLITFLQREPLGKGTHRIVWNGESSEGQLVHPPAGDSFLFGIFGYTLPDNAVYVRSGAHVSGLAAAPSVYDPTGIQDDRGTPNASAITFTLSSPAAVDLVVSNTETGKIVAQWLYPGLGAGVQTITWNGKDNNGNYVVPGRYRLGVSAIDARGFKSLRLYTLQRIYY